jgi:hypothetical protein
MIDAPNFAADRADFAKIFGSDDAAKAFLTSPEQVTKALGAYVWSLGSGGNPPPAAAPAAKTASSAAPARPAAAPASERASGGR